VQHSAGLFSKFAEPTRFISPMTPECTYMYIDTANLKATSYNIFDCNNYCNKYLIKRKIASIVLFNYISEFKFEIIQNDSKMTSSLCKVSDASRMLSPYVCTIYTKLSIIKYKICARMSNLSPAQHCDITIRSWPDDRSKAHIFTHSLYYLAPWCSRL